MLAFDYPCDIKTGMMRPHKYVNIVLGPDALNRSISFGVETKRSEESCCFFLIFLPIVNHW